jgi:magnesium transporter
MQMSSFYLSRILGNKLYTPENKVIGKIKDFGVDTEFRNPKVVTVKVTTNSGFKYLNWEFVSINKESGQYVITCNKQEEINVDNIMMLRKYVLDRQIIDVNGRKVVRVNDIRLGLIKSGVFVIAVDIGMEGILRRLSIAKPLKKMGLKISSQLMLWNDVQTTFSSNQDITLSKTYNRLSILHPSDLADIIEDFDAKTGMILFSSFDNAKAADVLEEMEEKVQLSFFENLSPDRAAGILEEMHTDEVADILDGLKRHKAEEILNNMEVETSNEIRELMGYDNESVGSLMNTDYLSFSVNSTVGEAINTLKELKPEEDQMYYLYIVDETEKLVGTISLRDIALSASDMKLENLMNKDYFSKLDTDEVDELIEDVSKYNLVAIPVVDCEMNLVGNVVIHDIIYELTKNNRNHIAGGSRL